MSDSFPHTLFSVGYIMASHQAHSNQVAELPWLGSNTVGGDFISIIFSLSTSHAAACLP